MKKKAKAAGRSETTQVLVVGGGPVGLCAALCAARRGLQVTLLEQSSRGYGRGHASLLHPSSVHLMAELGLSQQLLSQGRPLGEIQLYVDGRLGASLSLELPALSLPQAALEDSLFKALHREKVRITSQCQVSALEPGQDSVRATVVRRE